MQDKLNRKSVIARVIRERSISTQEELVSALAGEGVVATQATLSRDIRELGAVKMTDAAGVTRYVINSSENERHIAIRKIDISGQLCVVHVRPGFASALASIIDAAGLGGVMGTLAGDDTVLVMLRSEDKSIAGKIEKLV